MLNALPPLPTNRACWLDGLNEVKAMYQIFRVDKRNAVAVEPLGTKRKFWFSDRQRRMLFKAEERGTGEDWLLSEQNACPVCDISFPALTPSMFSFNSPMGMCPECNGLGTRLEFDPAKRLELHERFQRIIVRDQPYLFLWVPQMAWFVNNRIGNQRMNKMRPQVYLLPWFVKEPE